MTKVDRTVSDYPTGRWWTAEPKSAKPSHHRERGEVPSDLWTEYAEARRLAKLAERRLNKAELALTIAFVPSQSASAEHTT